MHRLALLDRHLEGEEGAAEAVGAPLERRRLQKAPRRPSASPWPRHVVHDRQADARTSRPAQRTSRAVRRSACSRRRSGGGGRGALRRWRAFSRGAVPAAQRGDHRALPPARHGSARAPGGVRGARGDEAPRLPADRDPQPNHVEAARSMPAVARLAYEELATHRLKHRVRPCCSHRTLDVRRSHTSFAASRMATRRVRPAASCAPPTSAPAQPYAPARARALASCSISAYARAGQEAVAQRRPDTVGREGGARPAFGDAAQQLAVFMQHRLADGT